MDRPRILLAAALMALAAPASAQAPRELVGAWTLVSSTIEQGGNKIQPFGADPKGALIFDANGRYVAMIARAGLPKIASNSTLTATAEEYKTLGSGTIAHFGSYVVDEKTITFRIETATFPNWNGTEQKRTFTLAGDELRYIGVSAVAGGASATLVWRRAK